MAYASLAPLASAELLPVPPLPSERSLWTNFELLPAGDGKSLPGALRDVESARLQTEEATVNGKAYRKTSVIAPLASGDRRETILLLAEEEGHMRMLGFHRIRRRQDTPEGNTVVFDSGVPNPLTGERSSVPPDTYTHLALCTALSGFGDARTPLSVHLWVGRSVTSAEVRFDGTETVEALGTRITAARIKVHAKSEDGADATYWFAQSEAHPLVQYLGPADFLAEDAGVGVLLRATASSEQIRKIFHE